MLNRKIKIGEVISNKADKTISVLIKQRKLSKLYKKFFNKNVKIMAHDPQNVCQIGDKVKIIESRPFSKRKRWIFLEKINNILNTK